MDSAGFTGRAARDYRSEGRSCAAADVLRDAGLFVPKPNPQTDGQRYGRRDLGTAVPQRPLTSTACKGDRYSVGYSAVISSSLGRGQ